MSKARHPRPNAQDTSPEADIQNDRQTQEALLKAGALQNAILNSANFSSIATDAKGVIQIFNVGAERMLGSEPSLNFLRVNVMHPP
jgi:PAS domain-containing protein